MASVIRILVSTPILSWSAQRAIRNVASTSVPNSSVQFLKTLLGMRRKSPGLTFAMLVTPVGIGNGFKKITQSRKDDRIQDFLHLADTLDASWRHEEEYSVLQTHLSDKDQNDPELLWRLARATYQLAQRKDMSFSQRRKLTEEAFAHVQRSLEIDNKNPDAHIWCAVITEKAISYRSVGEQVKGTLVIRRHLDSALQSQADDALLHYTMGIFCYNIAALSWLERNVARTISSTFPSSSMEEALKHFDKAYQLSPNSAGWRSLVLYAKCCMGVGQWQKASTMIKKAMELPVRSQEDIVAQKEAANIIKNFKGTLHV